VHRRVFIIEQYTEFDQSENCEFPILLQFKQENRGDVLRFWAGGADMSELRAHLLRSTDDLRFPSDGSIRPRCGLLQKLNVNKKYGSYPCVLQFQSEADLDQVSDGTEDI
jgi:hypothetical protein